MAGQNPGKGPFRQVVLLAVAIHALAACAMSGGSTGVQSSQQFGPGRITTETANAMVLAFADDHAQRFDEAIQRLSNQAPDVRERARLNSIALQNIQATWGIASAANPIVGMTDMVVMTSLSREAIRRSVIDRTLSPEERERPESFDVDDETVRAMFTEEDRLLYRASARSEEEIRKLAAQVFWPEQLEQLDALLAEWWQRNPSRRLVSAVRLQDFAGYRAETVETAQSGPRNLLGLLYLDPLASMDPTTREIAQSRMLAERITFQVNRLPSIVAGYARGLMYEALATEEAVALRTTLEGTETSLERFADVADRWPEDVAMQREVAFVQLSELVERERSAAIVDVEAALSRQRDELLEAIEERSESLQATLSRLDAALVSANQLSGSVTETARTIDDMDVENFRQLVDSLNEPLGGAERSLATVERVLASERLASTAAGVDQGVSGASASLTELVDHAFWRGVQLVAFLLVGGVIAALCFKLLATRFPS